MRLLATATGIGGATGLPGGGGWGETGGGNSRDDGWGCGEHVTGTRKMVLCFIELVRKI